MRLLILSLFLYGLLEIGLFIWIGSKIGIFSVFLLIILTAVIGIIFGRIQGFETWSRAIRSMENQQVPAAELVDGLCIIVGAVLLIIPGFLSDIVGLTLLIPLTRNLFKRSIANMIHKFVQNGTIIYRRF